MWNASRPCRLRIHSRSSTIRAEKRTNAALAYADLQSFVQASASVSTPRPPTTARVVAINRGPFLGAPATLEELDEIGMGTVLDVRAATPDELEHGHVHGPGAHH